VESPFFFGETDGGVRQVFVDKVDVLLKGVGDRRRKEKRRDYSGGIMKFF
jgi:hypothetical protein